MLVAPAATRATRLVVSRVPDGTQQQVSRTAQLGRSVPASCRETPQRCDGHAIQSVVVQLALRVEWLPPVELWLCLGRFQINRQTDRPATEPHDRGAPASCPRAGLW